LGVAFGLDARADLFVRARADMDFVSKDYMDIVDDSGDSMILTIPVEVGVDFSLN
jgi:hypothetical protein